MVTNSQSKIITFYSYKGGTGRSMILANVAWILASNGKRVLVVDWDLEAPGIHRYFHPFLSDKDLTSTKGLIDFLTDFIETALTPFDEGEGDEENWYEQFADRLLQHYTVSLDWKFPKGTLDFVPAGHQGNLYAERVNSFNWEIFYERFGGGQFLETVKEKMRAQYDYILIDSRTGISDTSGICTVQMPDRLVVFFTANDQNISGAVGVATSVNKQWQNNGEKRIPNQWLIYPVLARTDRTETDKLDRARNYVKLKFAPFLQHLSKTEQEEYWGNIEIPYFPWYAYEEVLVTFRDNPYQRDSLLAAIEQLVTYLTHKEVTELVPPNQAKREEILSQFTRQFSTKALDEKALKYEANSSRSFGAIVEAKKPDVFVSYARVDNEHLPGANKGWVTTLVDGLKIFLGQRLGHPNAYSLWMDSGLRGNEPVTSVVVEQLENSAILLVILSPGYLVSSWCRDELSLFLNKVSKGSERVFIVERDDVQCPDELSDSRGYKFWVKDEAGNSRTLATPKPNPEEHEYYQRLNDLARQLSDRIISSRKDEFERKDANSITGAAPLNAIFLAVVSDDLEERREAVKRYLEQQGVRVLPDKAYSFTNIRQYLEHDLSQCSLFVQLLSEKIGHGLPQFQYEQARAAKLPILLWRDSALDLNSVHDLDHLKLLSQNTVIASSLVEFQEHIINQLQPKEELIKSPSEKAPLVFINMASEDMTWALQMGEMLNKQGIKYTLPLEISERTKFTDIQKNLKRNLLYCDAVIVIYDKTSKNWVEEQVRYCRYMQALREQPFKIIAVCYKPPDKPHLSIHLLNLHVLECPTLQADTCLPEFIRILTT